MNLYSIYDKTAKRFNAPFMAENDEVAKRSFSEAVKGVSWSYDFELHCLGSYNVSTGVVEPNVCFITGFVGGVVNGEQV